jgi:hypothetical protein
VTTPAPAPRPFRERYLLARLPGGGVAVDLETGNYFRLDDAAAEVCAACIEAADAAAAAAELARRRRLPPEQAARMVADTQAALAAAPARGEPQGTYRFLPEPESSGYGLWHGSARVLAVDGDSLDVRLAVQGPGEPMFDPAAKLELYVRSLAPKLLFLRGLTVLHASACAAAGRLVAFAGVSHAGKTTTARAFAEAGARLVSEDLVVLGQDAAAPAVALDGEPRIRAWASRTAGALARGAERAPSAELAGVADGPTQPLDAVLFLDPSRRAGDDFSVRRLDGGDGLVALMENDFLGAASPRGWRRFFESAAALATATELGEVTAPAGAERVAAAARRYMSSWTS